MEKIKKALFGQVYEKVATTVEDYGSTALESALGWPGDEKQEKEETYEDIPVFDDDFLLDGKRVDFVLITVPSTDGDRWKENEMKRRSFERNLHEKKGLLITHVNPTMEKQEWAGTAEVLGTSIYSVIKDRNLKALATGVKDVVTTAAEPLIEQATDTAMDAMGLDQGDEEKEEEHGTVYTLVHAPWKPLAKCAETIMLRVPIREPDETITKPSRNDNGICSRMWKKLKFLKIDNPSVHEEKQFINDFFTLEKFEKNFYLDKNKATFFKDVDRSRMVFRLMKSARFSKVPEDFGIRRMLHENIYDDAYSLHDGDADIFSAFGDEPPENDRQRLINDWASFSRWYKYQPLNEIKRYFGARVAMYFAWLGTYTMMLTSASIVGLVCFLIGFLTVSGYQPANDVCNHNNSKLFYMCPLCDTNCSFWSLSSSCEYARYSHAVDYEGTVFFAAFMSFWCVIFLEIWKRKQISLAHEWDMMHFEEDFEPPRPAFVATVKEKRPNPVTGRMEPYIPRRVRARRYTIATVAIATMILMVLASVFGVVIYRAIVLAIMSATSNKYLQGTGRIYTSLTSAVLNLLSIGVMSKVYRKLAFALTNWENPRTRTEYQNILTVKMFLFQAVNTYSSFVYIAFFKTSFATGIPGHYRRMAGVRMEGCDPSGCTMELCIQLAVLLGGKQLHSQIKDILIPSIKRIWNRRSRRKMADVLSTKGFPSHPQWEMDQLLMEEPEYRMFEEYLEMVLQYGFVTMFVAAFPLAPLLALINNLLEIRSDAINFVVNFRRPTAQRAHDIGAWFGVLRSLSVAAIIINSLVIGFTSEFIPRQVYKYKFSPDGTLRGYMNNSLSYFDVRDLEPSSVPSNPFKNLPYNRTHCRFKEYFSPHRPYSYTLQYYYVLAARLAFVLVFNAVVLLSSSIVSWLIPDVPYALDVKMKREAYLARESLVQSKIREGMADPDDKDMLLSVEEEVS